MVPSKEKNASPLPILHEIRQNYKKADLWYTDEAVNTVQLLLQKNEFKYRKPDLTKCDFPWDAFGNDTLLYSRLKIRISIWHVLL